MLDTRSGYRHRKSLFFYRVSSIQDRFLFLSITPIQNCAKRLSSIPYLAFADAHEVEQAVEADAGDRLIRIGPDDRLGMEGDSEACGVKHGQKIHLEGTKKGTLRER